MDVREITLQPHQLDFVEAEESVVFFGGGAGGGKTFSALVDNLEGVHDPKYRSGFFRTSTTEMQDLWPEAKNMYHSVLFKDADGKKPRGKAHINEKNLIITFPSGAKTFFGYLSNDKDADKYYGREYTKIYFEEFQFRSWYQFNLLQSRNRSMARVKHGIRCTLNPDPDHFVFKFVERFLDEEFYPIKELSGKTAWFVIIDNVLHTSWDKQELVDNHPQVKNLMDEIREEYGDKEAELAGPVSYTYIPATLRDNKELMKNDPSYIAKLNAKPEKERVALLEGCWKKVESQGRYFRREWLIDADKVPSLLKSCRGYDIASSDVQPGTHPDFTASVQMSKDNQGYFYLMGNYIDEACDDDSKGVLGRYRKSSGKRDKVMLKQAQYDGKGCHLVIPQDPGAVGRDALVLKVQFFLANGFIAKRDPSAHNANKLTKFEPFCTAAEHGLVYIVRETFNDKTYEALMSELEKFDGVTKSGRTRKDDWVDSVATSFNHIAKELVIPSMDLPTMASTNPFRR